MSIGFRDSCILPHLHVWCYPSQLATVNNPQWWGQRLGAVFQCQQCGDAETATRNGHATNTKRSRSMARIRESFKIVDLWKEGLLPHSFLFSSHDFSNLSSNALFGCIVLCDQTHEEVMNVMSWVAYYSSACSVQSYPFVLLLTFPFPETARALVMPGWLSEPQIDRALHGSDAISFRKGSKHVWSVRVVRVLSSDDFFRLFILKASLYYVHI